MADPGVIRPTWPFLLGAALGFVGCCLAGRLVSRRPLFEHFVRLHPGIDLESGFYPTASELVSQVRGTVPRSKILVLVGGASYFRGAGQNAAELWTLELQRLLGSRYAVINFASDQAGATAFGGVAWQALARDYPGMIYVSSGSPVSPDPVDGGAAYRYIFWDAYYKDLLPPSAGLRALARTELQDPATQELQLGKWIDRFSYSCDLWTFLEYRFGSTVWSDATASSPFRARRRYPDPIDPNLRQEQQDFRNNRDYARNYEVGNRAFATAGFVQGADGAWQPVPGAFDPVATAAAAMFPARLRASCYIVLVRANPYFMRSFTADDRRRLDTIYLEGQRAYERAGYHVVQLWPADFSADDFMDGGHFLASGGRKVAQAVAAQILADRKPK
jgi:hypothetical protein